MIPQTVTYFRFESYTEGSKTFFAPKNYSTGSEYFFGYNISPYVIKYAFTRDVDYEPDTLAIRVEKSFFTNPNNNEKYLQGNLTDPENAFAPVTNHIIIIGDIPYKYDPDTDSHPVDRTYCYEDNEDYGSPVFFIIKSVDDTGSDYFDITGIALLKVLSGYTLASNFLLNNTESNVNDLQVFYEYNSNAKYKSDPYFAPIDTNSYNVNESRYYISRVIQSKNTEDSIPLFPRFSFTSTGSTGSEIIEKDGYEMPKIAWRLLQECGWCRKPYDGPDAMSYMTGSEAQPYNTFINPYETFMVDSEYYNENTMDLIDDFITYKRVKFRAFDTDGLRFEYNYSGQLDLDIDLDKYTQPYLQSFDPSKQSILYNLKTLAETSGMYLSMTCCPRIEEDSEGYNEFVWDASVYQKTQNEVNALSAWGVYAGFHPKVLIRRNPAYDGNYVPHTVEFGQYNENPVTTDTSNVLAKTITWEESAKDIINKVLVKYGDSSDADGSKYMTFPDDEHIDEPYFVIDFIGNMNGANMDVYITLNLCPEYGIYSFGATAPNGYTAAELATDLADAVQSEYLDVYASNTSLVINAKDADQNILDYWGSLSNLATAITTQYTYSVATASEFIAFNVSAIATEPDGFTKARNSQKENGIISTKISLPELKYVNDVIIVCDNIFDKLANKKYRCVTECNDIEGKQLPLFGYFNILDSSNSKQVLNEEGGFVTVVISGTATSNGVVNISLPISGTTSLIHIATEVISGYTGSNVCSGIEYYYNHVKQYHDVNSHYPTCTDDGSIIFEYGVDEVFSENNPFQRVSASTTAPGIQIHKSVIPASKYKQEAYDENLILLRYYSDSTKGTHACTFGLPDESLANILNQISMWVGDVEKSS